ncbi:pyrroloquinoline quinone-dependent dehydrogenase [Legionella yabuuchiae]|uniref:pyrroloquinoline quinone-dependent dehydrogenase n=1 Tax=Legionella yabuuchiae TaxID=376727 RepID=UPI001054F8F4|nr:pyrroloquinoline quinone-dependent dehydrogenase [Legionella yabuuchiae]
MTKTKNHENSSLLSADQDVIWPHYGNDAGGTRYSTLDQINRTNVSQLKEAWTYHTGDVSHAAPKTAFEATPLMVNDLLYVCTPFNRVLALHPGNGTLQWQFDPKVDRHYSLEGALKCRGLAYWEGTSTDNDSNACKKRIFSGLMDGRLVALDADTGIPCIDFGDAGQIDTNKMQNHGKKMLDFISPPAIYKNLVIMGASIGDNTFANSVNGFVRAFDAITGQLVWEFDPIPEHLRDKTGAANTWAPISVDAERELIYIATSSPSPDYYGAARTEDIPYANATVALDANTGKPRWHYQIVHHDLWDYDLPAQPSLIEVKRNGETIPAVVQSTKTGFLFVFHRETGEPLFPIEERPVPASDVPGERTSPTQPYPTHPKPYAAQKLTADDAWGMMFIDRCLCKKAIKALKNKGMFTPPSLEGSLQFPGFAGGSNWGGIAYDAERQWVIINSMNVAAKVKLVPVSQDKKQMQTNNYGELELTHDAPYSMSRGIIMSIFGAPCSPPPWGQLTAYNINTGDIVWQIPFGRVKKGPFKTLRRWGSPNIGGPIITKGNLLFIGATLDHEFHAYDIETGKELWTGHLPAPAVATPMTYTWNGRQYIVIAAGGHGVFNTKLSDTLIAYALPA